ncbi:hypothetical protein [Pseudothauera rhizosphaerae]|uniref:Uncharacterized protein n=1 Tax=Pseudothauera rhizosphaerae TaxID=2565932 RepID=A0A4V3WAW6_9RHOO|nr:hypothetical protein [Pseudothauera rhizosphaerae]THF60937.1 hypothetical protein E6O51_11960 [Pseudothauera rhizosphaerae]
MSAPAETLNAMAPELLDALVRLVTAVLEFGPSDRAWMVVRGDGESRAEVYVSARGVDAAARDALRLLNYAADRGLPCRVVL